MRKSTVVALREYSASVRSKSFVISLVIMPVLMFGGIFISRQAEKLVDTKDKQIAVIDRTGEIFGALQAQAKQRNETELFDKTTKKQIAAPIKLEKVDPVPLEDVEGVARQHYELSERVRRGEIFGFVEFGKDVFSLPPSTQPSSEAISELQAAQKRYDIDKMIEAQSKLWGENYSVQYHTNRPTYSDIRDFLQRAANLTIVPRRMAQTHLDYDQIQALIKPPVVGSASLYLRDSSGKITVENQQGQIASYVVPLALLALMYMVVMIGTSPLTTNTIEEKQLRIAEVLLGSISPFELMLGKLIGGVGTALTLASVYVAGGAFVAKRFEVLQYLTPTMLIWFGVFLVLGSLLYGSMFIAAGSAVTNVKEAQSLMMPIILLIVVPLSMVGTLVKDPSGPIGIAGSFFPFSAPLFTVARLGIPPGIPLWQAVVSALITLLSTVAMVWAAGRIFRVGILMQGQGAKIGQLIKWVFSPST